MPFKNNLLRFHSFAGFHALIFTSCVLMISGCGKKAEQTVVLDTTSHAMRVIRVEPVTGSPEYPKAMLTIISPREGQVLKNANDSVRIVMLVKGMTLRTPTDADSTKGMAYSKYGQHIHVIVDDKPYMADYQNGQPFNVGVLAKGVHTIRAFPAYSWHESIKSPGSFATKTFYVGIEPKQVTTPVTNHLDGPLLTYSRPTGTYTGSDTDKVLLDFYITNVTLAADGYKVKLWIDNAPMPYITKWQPYIIEGLSHGKHTIKLQLVDPKGAPVPGSYNNPSMDFMVG